MHCDSKSISQVAQLSRLQVASIVISLVVGLGYRKRQSKNDEITEYMMLSHTYRHVQMDNRGKILQDSMKHLGTSYETCR